MFEIILNILCLGVSAYLIGTGFLHIIKFPATKPVFTRGGGGANNGIRMDLAIVSGLCVLTVYAEFFSLFTNVSGMAFTFVILACFTIFIFLRKEVLFSVRKFFSKDMSARIAIIIIVAIPVLILAGQPASHYDTDLYHAQSIRWIEEYGIAPGLGNLHHRLAYNSAFFLYRHYLAGVLFLDVHYIVLMAFFFFFLFPMLFVQQKFLNIKNFLYQIF